MPGGSKDTPQLFSLLTQLALIRSRWPALPVRVLELAVRGRLVAGTASLRQRLRQFRLPLELPTSPD